MAKTDQCRCCWGLDDVPQHLESDRNTGGRVQSFIRRATDCVACPDRRASALAAKRAMVPWHPRSFAAWQFLLLQPRALMLSLPSSALEPPCYYSATAVPKICCARPDKAPTSAPTTSITSTRAPPPPIHDILELILALGLDHRQLELAFKKVAA